MILAFRQRGWQAKLDEYVKGAEVINSERVRSSPSRYEEVQNNWGVSPLFTVGYFAGTAVENAPNFFICNVSESLGATKSM
jgi:hypothetical protein